MLLVLGQLMAIAKPVKEDLHMMLLIIRVMTIHVIHFVRLFVMSIAQED